MNIEKLKKSFLKFWRSNDEKISFIRDILVAVFVVVLILSVLWTYTGQWFGAPMVAIESGSMMHLNEPFGSIGTIALQMLNSSLFDSPGEAAAYIDSSDQINVGASGFLIMPVFVHDKRREER